MDTLRTDVPGDGLPLADRIRLSAVNWLLATLSEPARIRWRWHVVKERKP